MNRWRVYAELSAAALAFVAAVVIGLLAGRWLDGALGTSPLFTLALMTLGLIGAVVNLLRALRKINEPDRDQPLS
jgi:F0F1-type ATP synthase assembly protein I